MKFTEAFNRAYSRVKVSEGGFTDDPDDRGNWTSGKIGVGLCKGTKCGISAMTYPNLDIRNLTEEEIKTIYYGDWWVKLGMDRWRPATAYQVFDAALNHGFYRASVFLQKSVDVIVDGNIGPVTTKAVKGMPLDDLLFRFLSFRLDFITNISTFDKYGRGWVRRVGKNLRHAAEDTP